MLTTRPTPAQATHKSYIAAYFSLRKCVPDRFAFLCSVLRTNSNRSCASLERTAPQNTKFCLFTRTRSPDGWLQRSCTND